MGAPAHAQAHELTITTGAVLAILQVCKSRSHQPAAAPTMLCYPGAPLPATSRGRVAPPFTSSSSRCSSSHQAPSPASLLWPSRQEERVTAAGSSLNPARRGSSSSMPWVCCSSSSSSSRAGRGDKGEAQAAERMDPALVRAQTCMHAAYTPTTHSTHAHFFPTTIWSVGCVWQHVHKQSNMQLHMATCFLQSVMFNQIMLNPIMFNV